MRTLLIAAGLIALALGLLGLVLPLLPTTPFLLVAAGCFSRSSRRLHRWLLGLPMVGAILADYEQRGGLSVRSKRRALVLVWTGIFASALVLRDSVWLVGLVIAIAFAVSVVIARLPLVTADV